jgi:hypothetical protein
MRQTRALTLSRNKLLYSGYSAPRFGTGGGIVCCHLTFIGSWLRSAVIAAVTQPVTLLDDCTRRGLRENRTGLYRRDEYSTPGPDRRSGSAGSTVHRINPSNGTAPGSGYFGSIGPTTDAQPARVLTGGPLRRNRSTAVHEKSGAAEPSEPAGHPLPPTSAAHLAVTPRGAAENSTPTPTHTTGVHATRI